MISPRLVLARNPIIMTGSVLMQSTEPFHKYAGVPERDVSEKLLFWKLTGMDEKIAILQITGSASSRDFEAARGRVQP